MYSGHAICCLDLCLNIVPIKCHITCDARSGGSIISQAKSQSDFLVPVRLNTSTLSGSLVPRSICGREKNSLFAHARNSPRFEVFSAILYAHARLLRACRRQQFVTSWPIVCPAHATLSNGSLSRSRRLERDA